MINKEQLKKILSDWSYWGDLPAKSIKRQVDLPKKLHKDIVFVIQGVRRSGKSTLLSSLPEHYGFDYKQCFFCNFEDPRLSDCLDYEILQSIFDLAREQSANKPCYFFFDEIQEVKNWQKFLHMQLERPGENYFVITGSNSSLLSGELATSLTGRHVTLELFPFKFMEFKEMFPKKTIDDYLVMGGFPKVLDYEKPVFLLQEYFSDIVNRDITNRMLVRKPQSVTLVAKMVFESCASELSLRKVAAVSGLTVDTVKSYLEGFENAYLIFSCPFFSYSSKQINIKNKKYYAIDPALRASVVNTAGRDLGKNLENLVFLRLRQKYKNVFYYKEGDGGEVDFVTLNGVAPTPYQVSLQGVKDRHHKALESFYKKYPNGNNPVFITTENAHEYI